MGRAEIPEHSVRFEVELPKHPVDDRRRVLYVALRFVDAGPTIPWEVSLRREGNSGEATARIPGGFPNQHECGTRTSVQIGGEILQADLGSPRAIEGGISVPILVEGRPDPSGCEITEETVERVHVQVSRKSQSSPRTHRSADSLPFHIPHSKSSFTGRMSPSGCLARTRPAASFAIERISGRTVS